MNEREQNYLNLPLEQRLKKGVVAMELWIQVVEIIFRKRGQATQEKIDTWLIKSTPAKNWKDKYKSVENRYTHQMEDPKIP